MKRRKRRALMAEVGRLNVEGLFCPHCGRKNNGYGELGEGSRAGRGSSHGGATRSAEGSDGSPPSPGDVSFCLHCGGVSIFKPDLRLRPATPEEQAEIPPGLLEEFAITRVLLEARGRLH